jgi:hypothetical protein
VVAAAAERALLSYIAAHPAAFAELLTGSSQAAAALAQLSGSSSSTLRMRALSLLVTAAASSRSHAEELKKAGVCLECGVLLQVFGVCLH